MGAVLISRLNVFPHCEEVINLTLLFLLVVSDVNRVAAVIQLVVQRDGVIYGMSIDFGILLTNSAHTVNFLNSCQRFKEEWSSSRVLIFASFLTDTAPKQSGVYSTSQCYLVSTWVLARP